MSPKHKIPIRYSEEIKDALATGAPVVALESNVITHGLEYPENAETAKKVAQAVRKGGAIPATLYIDNGVIHVGMDDAAIEKFATTSGIPKVSSRDLPIVLAQGKAGATTVASSLICAELAGISFFSSAGIGGVHRGGENSMDVSADLIQFTRSKVAVVCAGAKSILDLDRTMEYLETQCVPVVSYKSDDFPAFYCASSGIRSPHRMDEPSDVAKAIDTHWFTNPKSSFVITTPPLDKDAIDRNDIEGAIEQALIDAKTENIAGNMVTKYLMRAVDKASGGRTSKANMAVLISTAETGGRLAAAYSALQKT